MFRNHIEMFTGYHNPQKCQPWNDQRNQNYGSMNHVQRIMIFRLKCLRKYLGHKINIKYECAHIKKLQVYPEYKYDCNKDELILDYKNCDGKIDFGLLSVYHHNNDHAHFIIPSQLPYFTRLAIYSKLNYDEIKNLNITVFSKAIIWLLHRLDQVYNSWMYQK